jgi:hypothetical protein
MRVRAPHRSSPIALLIFLALIAAACRNSSTPHGQGAADVTASARGTAAGAPSAAPTTMPELLSDAEEGFADLTFVLERSPKDARGLQQLRLLGHRGATRVSFAVVLGPRWQRSDDPPITTFKGSVTFVRLGELSDAFVRELDRAYDTKLAPAGMADSVSFTGLSLAGDPTHLDAGPVKIKLFFDAPRPDAYAELFLDVDAERQLAQLREKDEEYRSAIVRALTRR